MTELRRTRSPRKQDRGLQEALRDEFRRDLAGTGKQDHELVAAGPERDITSSDRTVDRAPEAAQEIVAGVMTELVIDLFHPIEVDRNDTERKARACGVRNETIQLVVQSTPV